MDLASKLSLSCCQQIFGRTDTLKIPVVCGWIAVGTQVRWDTIARALRSRDTASRALASPITNGEYVEETEQNGIEARSGLTPQPYHVPPVEGDFDTPTQCLQLSNCLGGDVRGDERHEGPVYNYARIFTWCSLANYMHDAMSETLSQIENGRACRTRDDGSSNWIEDNPERNLTGDTRETAAYCGLEMTRIKAYPEWNPIPNVVWKQLMFASFMALFIQRGTTGPSLFIAYLTPTHGLGCRSGGYLLYGVLGTIVWLLLLFSMLLSHGSMLFYQRQHLDKPDMDFQNYKRDWLHWLMCGMAVLTRWLAKAIAIVNAVWIIISTISEYIGFYDNCWCKGNVLSLGDAGWVTLFKVASKSPFRHKPLSFRSDLRGCWDLYRCGPPIASTNNMLNLHT